MTDRNNVVLATAAHDGTIKFWHAASGVSNRTLQQTQGETQVNCLTTSSDKLLLAAGGQQNIRIFDTMSLSVQPLLVYQGHTTNVTSIIYQKDARWLASGSEDGTIKIWDPRAPGVQREIVVRSPVSSIALHPNQGEIISCDDDGSLRIWDLAAGKTSLECAPEEQVPCRSVSIASDGSMLALGNNRGNCYTWKLTGNRATSLEPFYKIDSSNTFLTKVLFSPNNKYIATCSADHTCKLWANNSNNANGGNSNNSNNNNNNNNNSSGGGNNSIPTTTGVSTTGSMGGLGNSQSTTNAASQQQFQTSANPNSSMDKNSGSNNNSNNNNSYSLVCDLYEHHGWVWDASFSADSAYIVTASSDRSAKLWDLQTSDVLLEYRGHSRGLTAVTLNDT